MPGSHGGSSSGGGGFHSSGGGFHSGGGGRSSGPRFSSRSSFPGAKRYYYTNRFGRTCFFYYAARPTRQNTLNSIIMPALFILAGIVIAAFIIYNLIPHKLSAYKCEATGVYVMDQGNLLGDTTELNKTLKEFYDKTGIEPCIVTVKTEDFNTSLYGSMSVEHLANYGYDLYLKSYDDEGHWMILYAEDAAGKYTWTDMAGDDTYDVTDDMIHTFASVFDKALVREVELTQAFNNAFSTVNKEAMKMDAGDKAAITFVVLFFIIWTSASAATIISTVKRNKTINEYCDYRDSHGGKDFYEGAKVTGSETVSYSEFTRGDDSTSGDKDFFD